MASNYTTGLATFGANVLAPAYLQKIFEDPLHADLVATPLGKPADLPKGMGKTVRWNRMNNPTAATTALTEGDPSEATTLTTATVTATLKDYGTFYSYSEFLELTAISGTVPEIVEQCGYQAALTVETLTYQLALTDNTQVDAGTALAADSIRTVLGTLHGLDAKHHPQTPGGRYYAGIFSPEQVYDMMGEGAPTWVQAKQTTIEGGMYGPWDGTVANCSIYDCIIKASTVVTTQSAASEEFGYIIGKGNFGTAMIGPGTPMSPAVYITPPSARVDRPLRDQGTIGWKIYYSAELLYANTGREVKSDIG
jgi:N4-gp56 family major capsid protein